MRFAVVYLLLIIPKLLLAEASKEEIPTVSELTEGILAFNCYEKADDFFPIILTEDTNGWAAIGIPDLDIIREVDNGFAFKSSKDDLLLAFLKEEGDNWQLEYFDEDGLNAAKCLEADEFAESIIEVIAPKIFDNANSLSNQLKLTKQELADEIARVKEREAGFRYVLTAKTNQYEAEMISNDSLRLRLADSKLKYENFWVAFAEGELESISKELKRVSLAAFGDRANFITSSKLKSFDYTKMMAENLEEECIVHLAYRPKKFDQKCEAAIVRYWLEN